MNSNYTFKGISFASMGVIIEKTPQISIPQKRIKTYTVAGRNGFLSVDEGTFEPYEVVLECHYRDDNVDKNAIANWLNGYGIISFDGETEQTAIVSNAIPLTKIQNFKKFEVSFTVNPIKKAITPTVGTITESQVVYSSTTLPTKPILEVVASGNVSLSVNGVGFSINTADGTYILDCEAMEITHNGVNASSSMNGEFPEIVNGANNFVLTGNITSVKITYRKCTI